MSSSTTLESWTSRIRNQLQDVLEPTVERYTEISPTEALTISLETNTKFTLIALAILARDHEDSALRTLALVTLREFVVRDAHDRDSTKLWDVIAVSTQTTVQNALLECFDNDRSFGSEREGKTLCRTCSYILELNNASGHGWPELDYTLRQLLVPGSSLGRQKLFYAFITEYPTVVADMQVSDLLRGLRYGLAAIDTDVTLVADAIKACVAILVYDDRYREIQDLVPEVLNAFPVLHARNAAPELSKSLYTILDLYNSPSMESIVTYIPSFVPFVLSLLPSTSIDYLRQASIEFLTSTSEYFTSSIISNSSLTTNYEEFVGGLLNIMTEMKNDEKSEMEFWKASVDDEDLDNGETYLIAEDALNRISVALGPRHVLPVAFRIIPSLLADTDWRKRYAALSAIGTLAESSVKEYKGDVEQLMRMINDGLSDPSPRIVYAAVYAAAEMCTYLGGVVQEQFGEQLLSSLFRIINIPYAPGRLIAYSCAALVNFSSDIGSFVPNSLLEHGPAIIERLLQLIQIENSRDDVRLKAMSAAGQTASVIAGEERLSPDMLQIFMETFWPFLSGDVEETTKARAIDCATLVAASVSREMLEPYVQRFITTLIHVEQTHADADDPCTMQVLTGLARLAGVLKQDFLPHVDSVIPRLLRIASTQVDQPYEEPRGMEEEDDPKLGDDEHVIVESSTAGTTVKINSESLHEKTQAMQLLTSLAHSLGVGLTETGESQNTTGEWMSYAETMLNVAASLVGYEYSSDVRQASAAALPALVRAFAISTRYPEKYNKNRMKSVVAPLLSAMAFEQDPATLSAQVSATSDIVLAAPDLFTSEDAHTFVNTCREQIEELQRVMTEVRESNDKQSLEEYPASIQSALEYMSASLQAFIKVTGEAFPVHGLADIVMKAVREQMGLEGQKEWALRLVCDLVQYASPAAVAWTSGLLPFTREGLADLRPLIRQISAFAVGTAASNPEGLYAAFCQSCAEPLCQGLSVETDLEDEDEALAHDNFVSALSKIIVHSDLLKIPADNLLPIWLKGLPIHMDVEEMTPTYSLLLDLIAREHPFIEPENEEVRDTVLNAFAATLDNPLLPQELRDPLDIAFKRYLSRTSLETQHAWHARLPA